MKGVLGWIKKRWYVIVSAVLIAAALPTAWIFSSGWNEKIRTGIETDATAQLNRLKKAKVAYIIPSVVPGEDDIVYDHAPNEALTEWVKSQRDTRTAESSLVMDQAIAFNRDGHGLVFDRWSPTPPDDQGRRNRVMLDYLTFISGDPQRGQPSAYDALFERHGAGKPADPIAVAQALAEQRDRDVERAKAESPSGGLDPEIQKEIDAALSDRRVGEYRRAAQQFSFYADPAVLDSKAKVMGGAASLLPPPSLAERKEKTAPPWYEGYVWLADYWAVEDVLRAIEIANTGVAGEATDVSQSAVKRILKLSVAEHELYAQPADPNAMNSSAPRPRVETTPGGVPLEPQATITGRTQDNALYDVRPIQVSLVVSSAQLPAVLEAFSEANMMTVLDTDLSEVDVWDDLRQGYYYGAEHVVRADITVESLWLRAWTTEWMPDVVKRQLGVRDEEGAG